MAKQQSPVVSSDDADDIIDLTEIVQKGKAPLASKPDVDFDSALSDLMGKAPAVKLNDTPELEALLSGIDDDAPQRRPSFKEDDEEGPVELQQAVPEADDMDSLLTNFASKKEKAVQPAEDVDSLLDSLMDDLSPPDSGGNDSGKEISDDDLDDLLTSIEQDSKQTPPKAAEPMAPSSLDDLLAGLDAPGAKSTATAQKKEMKTPDDLDDLLAGLNAPEPKPAKQQEPEPPSDLDDLLAGLNVAKPAKKDTKKAQDDLDKLLAGMDFSSPAPGAAPAPEAPGAEAKPVDNIDDLLAGLDSLAKPKASPKAAAADAADLPDTLDDLLSGLSDAKAPAEKPAAEAPVRGIPDADLDDLLAGLETAVKPTKTAPAKEAPAAAQEEKVDFGDLAALLDTAASENAGAADSAAESVSEDVSEDSLENAVSEAADSPDGPVDFGKPSFDAKDFDDLDALFAEKTPDKKPAAAAALADPPQAVDLPAAGAPVHSQAVSPELAENISELTARVERVESELSALQERVALLENQPDPQQEQLAAMLVDGTPLCNRLMELMRSAIAQELKTLSAEAEGHTQAIGALENRAVSMEGKLAEVAIMAAKAVAGPENPEPGLSAADLAPLNERLDKLEADAARLDTLEASSVRQEELDVLSERLDGLEESAAKAGEVSSEPTDTSAETDAALTPDAALPPEALAKLEQRLAVLEARPYVPLETIQGAFDQMGEQLNGPLQQFQNRITALEQRLADEALPRLATDLVPFMSESIDKAAAASAAQALREELALMFEETSEDEADDVPDEQDSVDFPESPAAEDVTAEK